MIKIPTDNLYKFLSIFGIVLICIGVNNAIATLDIYKMKELEVNKKIMKWKEETNLAAKEEITALKRAKKRKVVNVKVVNKPNELMEFEVNTRIIKDSIMGKIKSDLIEIGYLENKYNINLAVSISSLIIGALLSIIGFSNWYINTQKPIDSYSKKGKNKETSDMFDFDDIK